MTVKEYIDNINKRFKLGNATEHTFRGDLQQLIESIVPDVSATNEPRRQSCGAPDYILTRKDIPVGFIEAKDIGDKDLEGAKKTGNKEQFDRYKASLNNLIFTDYLNFLFYKNGQFITSIKLAHLVEKPLKTGTSSFTSEIESIPENFDVFKNLLINFSQEITQTIKSSLKLAEMMAGKARLLSDVIEKALTSDETHNEDSTLKDQMIAFKEILIHDITPKGFADVYAQTIAYGMFAARLHDPTLPTFSRQEAAELIPKSNPFLRKLFGYIAGPDIDDRIKWIVDSLVDIFLACNVAEILKNYGKATKMEDPIIHFYETFLSEYDPKLRKARGVWYTPQPVVNFIVRAVDDILKTEFDLPQGLADTSKTKVQVNLQGKKIEQEIHKVQILDPATGTGTFLAEVIKQVHTKFESQKGIWSNYVETHLLPRLNGFELLMASYAMAHLQLDLLLTETGYKPTKEQRLKIYLTNSLEESHPDTGTLFANWLSAEANAANQIKRDVPVMCIIGNPPYSGESANKGEWIMNLMEDYKKEPGGKEKLKERNPKAINDDYVKFLRYGQYFIEKNGSGVLAFINPHGFIDNLTYRGMRWNLLKTYDKIYTIDLHGNAKKKEIAPDGSADINVFDIEQGVSINFFIKTGKKKPNELGQVFHYDLFGKRELKYNFLSENNLKSVPYKEVKIVAPNYFFVTKDFKEQSNYNNGISVNELFPISTSGIKTHSDGTLVNFTKHESSNQFYNYRPFDIRNIEYDLNKVQRHRFSVMKHMLKDNLAIMTCRQLSTFDFQHILISKYLVDMCTVSLQTKETTYAFPLYLYPEINGQQTISQTTERTPNLNTEIVKQIAEKLGLIFTNEKETTKNTFAPIDILDYIYAVLHSPTYREKYKEFLKIDFPRVPYPKDANTFWQLVKLGGEIRQIHLLESPIVETFITQYPIDGDNVVTKIKFISNHNFEEETLSNIVDHYDTSHVVSTNNHDAISFPQPHLGSNDSQQFHEPSTEYIKAIKGKVYINDTQYFDNVPEIAWNFYIGGYQPAQKWLKDRKDKKLEFEDILHYQKIIVALSETDRLMKEIDNIALE